jgi:hypothetical protein
MLAFDRRLSGLRLDSLGLLHFKAALLRSD